MTVTKCIAASLRGVALICSFAASAARADPVEDFYRGKTIEIAIAGAAAGGYDVAARTLAAHISRHIAGNPTVIVKNMPGAAGLIVTNYPGLSNLTVNKADWLRDGKVRILLQFGNERLPQLPDVPTAIELASSDADRAMLRFYGLKFTMARPLLIPPGVPAERTAALQAAFEATMTDSGYIDDARRIGLDTNWLGAKALTDRVRDIADTPQPVVDHLHELLAHADAK